MATFQDFLQQKNTTPQSKLPTAQQSQGNFQQFKKSIGTTTTKKKTIPFWERNGLIQSILSPAYRLGQDFARTNKQTQSVISTAEQTRKETVDLISREISTAPLHTVQKERLGRILDDNPLGDIALPRTQEQVIGDIIQTVALVTPFGIQKNLISNTALRLGAEGALVSGTFGLGGALSEKKDPVIGTLKGAAVGAVTLGTVGLIGMGASKVMDKVLSNPNTRIKFIESVGVRLKKFGNEGEEISNKYAIASDKDKNQLGQFIVKQYDTPIKNMAMPAKTDIGLVLDGYAEKVPKISPEQEKVVQFYKETLGDVAKRAQESELKIRTADGKIYEWNPKKNYLPHRTDFERLQTDKAHIQDVLETAVKRGDFKTIEEGQRALTGFLEAHLTGEKDLGKSFWVKYLTQNNKTSVKFTEKELQTIRKGDIARGSELASRVSEAQAEAIGSTSRYFKPSRIRKIGNLEKQREMFNPFYDPNPESAILGYMNEVIPRLNKEEVFGRVTRTGSRISAEENISQIVGKGRQRIANLEGKTPQQRQAQLKEFNDLIDAAFGVSKQSHGAEKVSALLRGLSVPKLAFAAPINLGQGFLNPLLKASPFMVLRGYAKVFTRKGWRDALESGATLESVIHESINRLGESSWAAKLLKWTGFTWTERVNRVASANIGMDLIRMYTKKLLKNPTNTVTRARIVELGLNPEEILARGMLTPQEMSRAALRFTEQTQFYARPIDLPLFANSPTGKLFFQFKSFAYNQTKLLKDEFVFEVRNKTYGSAVKNMFIISAVFPMTGEVLADVQSLASGSKRPTNALDRYFDSLSRAGGFGVAADFTDAILNDRVEDFLLGPTVSSGIRLSNSVVDLIKKGKLTNSQKRFIIGQLGITRPIGNYAFPTENKDYEQFFVTLKDLLNE